MGLHISIYKDEGRSYSNGGLSDRYKELTLVNVSGPSEPTMTAPAALLVKGNLPGCVKVVEAVNIGGLWAEAKKPGAAGPMFGGTFAYTSDSRLHEAVKTITGTISYGAVPIHDRFESQELADTISR